MSTTKISDLPVLSTADAADEFVVVDDSAGVTKKITQAGLADFGTNTLNAAGINFGADTLDDYEEGSFTPFYTTSGNDLTGTTDVKSARYIRVGNVCHVTFYISHSGSPTGSGNLRVGGLPFAVRSQTDLFFGFAPSFTADWDTYPSGANTGIGSTYINLVTQFGTDVASVNASDMGPNNNDSQIIVTASYFVA